MRKRMSWTRSAAWLASASVALYVLLSLAGGVLLMEAALHVPRRPLNQRNVMETTAAPWALRGVEDVAITASDGAMLKGWLVQPVQSHYPNGGVVLLLHGVGDNRQGMMQYAPMLLRSGYAVLLPDARAHGISGGDRATYGLLEVDDVRQWLRWAHAHSNGAHGCSYLLGESMGAAVALEAAAPPEVCAVVAEAPFTSFREIGYERIAQGLGTSAAFSHVAAWPIVNTAFAYARLRYGLNFDEASPEHRLAASRVPALIIAGLSDRNIPPRHAQQIMKTTSGNCQLWLVPGADHTTAASVAPEEFEHRVLSWFGTHRQ
jgi:uncharacterized protein